MIVDNYCTDCMNTGTLLDGSPCPCKFNAKSFYESVACLDIPEQYRNILFSKYLVPKDLPESYGQYLENLHEDIASCKLKHKNVCICSPVGHSKSILAYSTIERLFRQGVPTFPVYDVLEIKRIILDMDLCRKGLYNVENPELLLEAPYVFIRIPRVPTWEVYDTISLILDRRVRRGNSTIFLYGGTWEHLIRGDKQDVLVNLIGPGNFNTLEVKTWFVNTTEKVNQLLTETNIG